MHDLSTDAITRRVASLEREAQRLKYFLGILALMLVGTIAIGASTISRTSGPFAVTQNGVTRVQLDAAGLHIYDGSGKQRIFLGFNTHNQPALHLIDIHNQTRESIYLDPHSSPSFDQNDKKGNTIASYYLGDNDGFARIEFSGSDNKDRFYVDADNTPFLAFGDAQYNNRMTVGLTKQGSGLLRMEDTFGHDLISIEGQDGGPFIRISQENQERVYLGMYTDGESGILFENASGTKMGSYP